MKILEINDNEEDKNNFINMVLKMLLKNVRYYAPDTVLGALNA